MIFERSNPPERYGDYRSYRPLLRHDFKYRCAYCRCHEYFLGGEAGCSIDHHRPVSSPYGRPDLIAEYENLYWCCRECNENKGAIWPSPNQYAQGFRFRDPCSPDDDHDLHLRILANGMLEPITNTGWFTSNRLKLWRDQLT